jgi:hypothetical protein
VRNSGVPDRYISDLASRANIAVTASVLILWTEKNCISRLREASPIVFHQIIFDQYASGVLEFKVILRHHEAPILAFDDTRTTWHPLPGLKEMIAADFDIRGSQGGLPSTKHHAFRGGFQKIVGDFIWTILMVAHSATHCVRVCALTILGAVKVTKIGVHHRHVTGAIQRDTDLGVVTRCTVEPAPIDDDVMGSILTRN